jgi:hypothetical protein
MFRFIGLCLGTLVRLLRARRSLPLENLALRQQLAVLKHRHPRPRLDLLDKLFWVAVRRFWSGWQQSLIVVTPETVVRWHRAGFRLYWKLIYLRNHREAIAAMDLLYCSDDHLQRALLFFRHQSRSSAHPALQCHKASDKLVDRSAVARSISI